MDKNKIIGQYQNGNYIVTIYEDGTKIRENNLEELIPSFAESIDLTITNKCDGLCGFCYMDCNPNKPHAELLLNRDNLWNSLHPYIELALNVNDMTHPELNDFLLLLKEKNVIPNITINMRHLNSNYYKILELIDKKKNYCNDCDIRPIIIDSNSEGLVIVLNSSCNVLVGKLFNMLLTTILDISC